MTRQLSYFLSGIRVASERTGARRTTRLNSLSCLPPARSPIGRICWTFTPAVSPTTEITGRRARAARDAAKGNLLLRKVFEWAHDGPAGRARVLPFSLFDKPGRAGTCGFAACWLLVPVGSAARKTSSPYGGLAWSSEDTGISCRRGEQHGAAAAPLRAGCSPRRLRG